MVEINEQVRRGFNLWQGVNEKTVSSYQKELEECIEALNTLTWQQERLLAIGRNDRKKDILSILKDEIDLCHYYFEYNQRRKEENFDKWFFVTQEDRKKVLNEPEWSRDEGDCWVRFNGKTRAVITLDVSGMMTKISLCVDNDAKALKFLDGRIDVTASHLKNEESIKQRINEYKALAEERMKVNLFPRYCSEFASFEILKKLLHVEEEAIFS